jgi:thioredoxin-related protein
MKPIVDGLESEFSGDLVVIRLNVQDPVGRELATQYDFRYTPTFIFFDAQGTEIWRTVGKLGTERVRASIKP